MLLSKGKIPLTAVVTGKPSDPEKNYVIKGIKEIWSPLTFGMAFESFKVSR